MRKMMLMVALCVAACTLWAQNEVSLVVSSEGKDKEEATLKALRSAIEQAYGTFVSANTTVLNDQLVADEIVSLSSGNIQKYEYVSENKMPNGNTFVTLSATVSIDKLVSFAESKGMEAELKGSLFAMNIKKMEFDKKAEEKAVENLCKQLETMLPSMFDYVIEVGNPTINQENPNFCDVNISVGVVSTEAFYAFCSTLFNTMTRIALDKNAQTNYESMKVGVHGTELLSGPWYYDYNVKNENNHVVLLPLKSGYSLNVCDIVEESTDKADGKDCKVLIVNPRVDERRNDVHIDFPPLYFRSDSSITMIRTLYSKLYNCAYNFIVEDGLQESEFYLDRPVEHLISGILYKSQSSSVHVSDIRNYAITSNIRNSTRTKEDEDKEYNFQDRYDYVKGGVFELWANEINGSYSPAYHTPYGLYNGLVRKDNWGMPIGTGVIKNNRFCTVWATLHYPISDISKITSITVRNAEYNK